MSTFITEDNTDLWKSLALQWAIINCDFQSVLNLACVNRQLAEFIKEEFQLTWLVPNHGIQLYPHQIESIMWMRNCEKHKFQGIRGGLLSLRMGLGKTFVSTSVSLMTPRPPDEPPTLVIVPKTLLLEWRHHFQYYYGHRVKVLYAHRDYTKEKELQTLTYDQLLTYDFVVTSYDVVRTTCHRYYFEKGVVELTETGKLRKINYPFGYQPHKHDCPPILPHNPADYRGLQLLFTTIWPRIIADESQQFCNPSTNLFVAMMALPAKIKWCLTGTPVKNHLKDVWGQLRWCGLHLKYKYYHSPHCILRAPPYKLDRKSISFYDASDIRTYRVDRKARWREWMYKDFSLKKRIWQMEYRDTNIKLFPLQEHRISVKLSKEERDVYQSVLKQTIATYRGCMVGGNRENRRQGKHGQSFTNVLAMFMRLRQICIAPYLISINSKRGASTETMNQMIETKLNQKSRGLDTLIRDPFGPYGIYSSKISQTLELVQSILPEKILIFTNFTSSMDLLKLALSERLGLENVLLLDGQTLDRSTVIDQFQSGEQDYPILILNYAVGANGLNLMEANHVILLDQWWCPTVHHQAIARTWRIGQTKPVHAYRLITEDTIEDKMIENYCNRKVDLIDDLYESKEVKLDKWTLGDILGVNGYTYGIG